MTTSSTTTPDRSGYDRALRWIGDLDHPFYRDERRRFVWYEASSIGFQLVLMLQYLLAAGAVLVMGRDALPYAGVGLIPVAVAAIVVAGYTKQRGTQYLVRSGDMRRSRSVAGVVLALLFVAALTRLALESGSGFVERALALGGLVAAVVGLTRSRPDED